MTVRARRWLSTATAVGVAAPADAHLVDTGFGAFYDGFAHLVLAPADLLVVIALALLAGQRGILASRWTLFALPVAWLAGGALGARFPVETTLPLLTTLSFGLAGVLVALDARLHAAAIVVYAILCGLAHGYVSGAGLLGLTGTATAVFCLVAILSAVVTALEAGWMRIAVRVAGSWVAAAGLLMLGWLARPGA